MPLVLASRRDGEHARRRVSRDSTSARIRRASRMAGGAAALAMPLTAFQSEVLAVLAANRSESSHFAGGLVLNAGPESARYSMDFDIFHDVAVAVEATRPWEKPSDFRKARVSRGGDHVDVVSCSTLLSRRGEA